MSARPRRAERVLRARGGYSLMEVLAVLAMTAMIAVLLFDGVGGLYRLRAAVEREADAAERDLLVYSWWRESVRGLVQDYPDGSDRFQGGPDRFTGLTLSPLHDAPGAPRPFGWVIRTGDPAGEVQAGRDAGGDEAGGSDAAERGAWLGYIAPGSGSAARLSALPDGAEFRYLDEDGAWAPTWAGEDAPLMIALVRPDAAPIAARRARAPGPPIRDTDVLRTVGE